MKSGTDNMPERVLDAAWPQVSAARALVKPLLWRVNRLRCMSGAEIRHRALRAVAQRAENWGLRGARAALPPDLRQPVPPWIHTGATVGAARYLSAADRIAAGRLDVFALQGVELGSPPRWNRDPKTGIEAPMRFGKLLNYRDPRLVGDIKYLWEPNRHLHLVTLAQAYALSGGRHYFDVLREHVASWIAACPCGMGANWSSALEAGLRLINWSVAWQFLGGPSSSLFADAAGARFRQEWLQSVHQHARFIHGHFSLYSSANNHLIGEAAGLYIAAVTWPYWPQAPEWRAEAKAILEREALLQNAPDGVNREQAIAYQEFELDLLLLPLFAARANGHEFSAAYRARIEAMLECLASLMDAGGNVPMFGDSDDGEVLRLAQGGGSCRRRSLLATGALLFARGDFRIKAGGLDDKTRWLWGPDAEAEFNGIDTANAVLPVHRAFPEGGYYILGCGFETESEIRLVVDAGPLGYQGIAAHGHADALSFTLAMGGMEFLIDPGTYAYHANDRWRQYFRGTAAHNTVRVDREDQSQPGGNFMWLRKANAAGRLCLSGAECDVFEGWHDGYRRLADPVLHWRRITLYKTLRCIVIEDTLEMSRAHEVELFFHCSEHCRVTQESGGYRLARRQRVLHLTLPSLPGAVHQIHTGSTAPTLGWVSRRFDEKQPTATIAWRAELAGKTVLRSEIRC